MASLRETTCCVGGGPAGIFAGLLLARQGVEVTAVEEHGDFLRDFRGDTIHPSTLELLVELGWIDELRMTMASPGVRARTPEGAFPFIQRRRELPTRITQAFQTRLLRGLYPKTLADDGPERAPKALELFRYLPWLRHLTGRFIGLGVRPEHIASRAA